MTHHDDRQKYPLCESEQMITSGHHHPQGPRWGEDLIKSWASTGQPSTTLPFHDNMRIHPDPQTTPGTLSIKVSVATARSDRHGHSQPVTMVAL
jgi:hypothetical protein